MSRLQRESARLYGPAAAGAGSTGTRVLVLEVTGAASWAWLSAVWKGVQAELELPASAIAVNGRDGLQLWISLAEPASPAQAGAFLDGLARHYLADLPAARVRAMPAGSAAPGLPVAPGQWSAYVAPDLAPIFDETPWLDVPPGEDGQADLLARLRSVPPAVFEAALQRLQPLAAADTAATAAVSLPAHVVGSPPAAHEEAVQFLRSVMNDLSAPLALRIQAAAALLPWGRQPPDLTR